MTSESDWDRINLQPRRNPGLLGRSSLPARPGVYAWYRDDKPVYVGVAVGQGGLRSRLWTHLAADTDLSRSAFRRNVLEHLEIATVAIAGQRPSVLTAEQVAPVNRWIRECEVAWLECVSGTSAKALERTLLTEARPLLNRR